MKDFLKIKTILLVVLIFGGSSIMASNHHDGESNKPSGTGSCTYTAENPFAGDPYKACRTNMSEEACYHYAEEGDGMVTILEPVYAAGDCSRETSIGSCERGGWEEVYYEGESAPEDVEFGCMFAGDWIAP